EFSMTTHGDYWVTDDMIELRSRLTLCQSFATLRASAPIATAPLSRFSSQIASSSRMSLLRLGRPYLPSRLIHGSPGPILLLSAWRTRGGNLCACPACSMSFPTFSGSRKERPQRRLPPIGGVLETFWRLS